MKKEYNVRLSFEVWIDLDDFDGEEITEQDICNAFGRAELEVSDRDVIAYIRDSLDPETIYSAGSVQDAKIVNVEYSGSKKHD